MTAISKILALARMGWIHPKLAVLAWQLKRSKRTFLGFTALSSLAKSFMLIKKRQPQPVNVAEFGVGRGGSAILLAWLVDRYGGKLTLYDIFSRIPAPTEIDGASAQARYDGILTEADPDYYGNIPDLLAVVTKELHEVCDPSRIEIVQGRYEETLVSNQDARSFGLVHIDCDWYDSSMVVYNYLRQRVTPGAILQVDDYSTWEGSQRAFQEADWLHLYQTSLVDGVLVIDTGCNARGKLT